MSDELKEACTEKVRQLIFEMSKFESALGVSEESILKFLLSDPDIKAAYDKNDFGK